MSLKNILITAQSFGYGPSSKAVTIASEFKREYPDIKLTFVGNGTSLTFVRENKLVFDEINEVKDTNTLDNLIDTTKYDHVISVMEPITALLANKKKLSVSYVDSLYFFWNWKDILLRMTPKDLKANFEDKGYSQCLGKLLTMHPHEMQLVGHLLSTQSFVQRFPGFERYDILSKEIGHIVPIGPIINLNKVSPQEKDLLLISFCGQLSPVVDLSMAINYATLCLDLINGGLEKIKHNITPLIVGNPIVMNKLRKHTSLETVSLSHDEYLCALNRAVGLIVPVSITSIYEALAYNVPVVFLPEQHDGHGPNHMRLAKANEGQQSHNCFPGVLFYERFPHLKELPEEGTVKIYDLVTLLKKEKYNRFLEESREIFKEIIPKLANNRYRLSLLEYQRKKVELHDESFYRGSLTLVNKIVNSQ